MAKSHSYQPRLYREAMGNSRWIGFRASYMQTDLWVALDNAHYRHEVEKFTLSRILFYRGILEDYIAKHPIFLHSLTPVEAPVEAHPLIMEMIEASLAAGTGPMSTVAGALAEKICDDIKGQFNAREVIVENGGDVFMHLVEPTTVSVFAGTSPLSDKITLVPGPAHSPLAVCCSSATVGHALSFGTADACTVACRSGALADALATAFCNEVKTDESVLEVANRALQLPEVMSIVIIRNDRVGMGGSLDVKFT